MSQRSQDDQGGNEPGQSPGDSQGQPRGAAAVKERPATRPAHGKLDRLPPYRVMLHNDDVNDMLWVVDAILDLTTLKRTRAFEVMMTAHTQGVSMILLTHKERAELYRDQFRSKGLTVTIEPNE